MQPAQIDFVLVDVLVNKFVYSDQILYRSCTFFVFRFDVSVT